MANHSVGEEILMNVPSTPVVEKWWQHCNRAYHRIRIIKWKKKIWYCSWKSSYPTIKVSSVCPDIWTGNPLFAPSNSVTTLVCKEIHCNLCKKTVGKKLLLLIIRWVNTRISSWVLNMRKLNSESHWLLLNSQGTAMSKRNLRQIHLQ